MSHPRIYNVFNMSTNLLQQLKKQLKLKRPEIKEPLTIHTHTHTLAADDLQLGVTPELVGALFPRRRGNR